MKTQKQNIIKFFKKLTTSLNETITDTKLDFQNNSIEPKDIKPKLLSWKSKYSQLVSKSLKQNVFVDDQPEGFNFKSFMTKLIADFGQDVEFMDQIKSLNISLERLKQFIRETLVKDPSLFQIN